jgi:hypothetical protein
MYLLRILSLMALFVVALSPVAMGDVGGSIEWDYGHYESDEAGVNQSDMSHFAQKYDLYLTYKGLFLDGRAGEYDFLLGGEWLAVNADIDVNGVSDDYSVSTGKLLYRGNINFAPGGLPFRFNAYARDVSKSQFSDRSLSGSGWFEDFTLSPNLTLLSSNTIDDIYDGQHFEMGGAMIIGIKNGSYLGRYRDVLSHLPKLYVNYRETRVKDLESRTPRDYVDRELAFVSLNKKHNWFHYRFFDHTDNLNPLLHSETKSYLLGTVDQNMRREWINLTNWIQLSVDASFRTENNVQDVVTNESQYALNFFTKTERRNWSSSVFSRFWRLEEYGNLERFAHVPIYAQGTPDRDNAWRFRFVGTAEKDNLPFALVNRELDEDVLYSKVRWETNKTHKNTITSVIEVEKKFGDRGEGWAARTTFEYFTNRDLRLDVNTFYSLSLAYFAGVPTGAVTSSSSDLYEAVGQFNISKQVNSRLRTGLESLLLLGSGQSEVDITDYITPLSRTGFFAGSTSNTATTVMIDGTVWRGRLMLFADHHAINRSNNRYELAAEYQDNGIDPAGQYLARHRYRYNATPYRITILTEILYGEDLGRSVNSRAFGTALADTAFDGSSLSNEVSVDYRPNRKHRLGGRMWTDYRDQDLLGSEYRLALQQDYRYTRYASVGVVRRLFELSEFLDYERLDPAGSEYFEAVALTGVGNYYPTSWTRFGGKIRWQHDIDLGDDDVGFGLYTDFNFSLLNVGLEYEYGMRTVDSAGVALDRTEQRWRVSIKKTF